MDIEPKWDGFRGLILRDPDEILISEPRCEIAESMLSLVARAAECAAARSMRSRRPTGVIWECFCLMPCRLRRSSMESDDDRHPLPRVHLS